MRKTFKIFLKSPEKRCFDRFGRVLLVFFGSFANKYKIFTFYP